MYYCYIFNNCTLLCFSTTMFISLYDLCFTNFTRYGNMNLIFISNK